MFDVPGTIVRIAAIHEIAHDVRSFELVAAGGGSLPPFSAGSHIDIALNDGLMRQYSLLNAPSERDRYVIAVAREPAGRGGSVYMHDTLAVGDELTISSPRCHFALVEDAPTVCWSRAGSASHRFGAWHSV